MKYIFFILFWSHVLCSGHADDLPQIFDEEGHISWKNTIGRQKGLRENLDKGGNADEDFYQDVSLKLINIKGLCKILAHYLEEEMIHANILKAIAKNRRIDRLFKKKYQKKVKRLQKLKKTELARYERLIIMDSTQKIIEQIRILFEGITNDLAIHHGMIEESDDLVFSAISHESLYKEYCFPEVYERVQNILYNALLSAK